MRHLCEKNLCTGCMACFNICKHQAISMKEDNEGFIFPEINNNICTGCGLCEQCCPVLHHPKNADKNEQPEVFAGLSKDSNILTTSASGGVFSTLAKEILQSGGIVYGAAFDNNLKLKHIRITDLINLHKLQGSKYIQSYIGNIYQQVKQDLATHRNILFSGTPCQIAGLKKFLHDKEYPQLILIDLVCHGVPSQKIFDVYCEKIATEKIYKFQFRSTKTNIYETIYSTKGKQYKLKYSEKDCYTRAYLKGLLHRKSCYNCPFSRIPRQGDITIGDFWSIIMHKIQFKESAEKGISCILINTNKGKDFFQQYKTKFIIEQKPLSDAVLDNHNIIHCDSIPRERMFIYSDFFQLTPKEISIKYNLFEKKPPIKEKIIICLRKIKRAVWNNL